MDQHERRAKGDRAYYQFKRPSSKDTVFIKLDGLLPTTTPRDIIRTVKEQNIPAWDSVNFGEAVRRGMPDLASKVESVRRIYEPATLKAKGSFILKVTDSTATTAVAEHMKGRCIGGRVLSAEIISAVQADLHDRIAIDGLLGSSDRSESALGLTPHNSAQIGTALRKMIQSVSGHSVILRGLPQQLHPRTVFQRLSRQYAMDTSTRLDLSGSRVVPIDPVYKLKLLKGQDVKSWTQDIPSGTPLAYSTFLIRLASAAAAHRLVSNFNAKIWRVYHQEDRADWDDGVLEEGEQDLDEAEEEVPEWDLSAEERSQHLKEDQASDSISSEASVSRNAHAPDSDRKPSKSTSHMIDGIAARSIDEDFTSGERVSTQMRTYVIEAHLA